ncbi:S8 family serine peptidase [Okeania sp. SIO2C2]|uniref:S8 family serine peptidase n=1 Tax=Okeania sp. SIO2C2 TaxID=2607787 RepID=UPI00257DC452|nr:S8 family serine peptidase [Okeania sp. SIO2C2]
MYGSDPNRMYEVNRNHGTACAGVAAAEADAAVTVGAAPGCQLLFIKWENAFINGKWPMLINDDKILTALNYIADKVDILSNSWGNSSPRSSYTQAVNDRITELAQYGGRRGKGIVFLWAAGNENTPVNENTSIDVPSFPLQQGFDIQRRVITKTARLFRKGLADHPNVMFVAAVGSNAQRSHYSNYGDGIDICAPSNNSNTYNGTQYGLGITTALGTEVQYIPQPNIFQPIRVQPIRDTEQENFGGTSSATPLVAGIAALVISANPELRASEVISILKRTASKDLNFQGYERTPSPINNSDTSWDVSPVNKPPFQGGEFRDIGSADGTWSRWFGHGRVDARDAVNEALNWNSESKLEKKYYASVEPMVIPDAYVYGDFNTIYIEERKKINELRVNVDIVHPRISDLGIRLHPPFPNVPIILHNRTGAFQANLKQTYTIKEVPLLASLKGVDIFGTWGLLVSDFVFGNYGTLQSWSLEIDVMDSLIVEMNQPVAIPDNNLAGIPSSIQVDTDWTIQDLDLTVDITHPRISDLQLKLITPDNRMYILQDRQHGFGNRLIKTWNTKYFPIFNQLRGTASRGQWLLNVADVAGFYFGQLNRWSIDITGVPRG